MGRLCESQRCSHGKNAFRTGFRPHQALKAITGEAVLPRTIRKTAVQQSAREASLP